MVCQAGPPLVLALTGLMTMMVVTTYCAQKDDSPVGTSGRRSVQGSMDNWRQEPVREHPKEEKDDTNVVGNTKEEKDDTNVVGNTKEEKDDTNVVGYTKEEKDDTNVVGYTKEEKGALVFLHNAYRSAVVPTASNMVEMIWDDSIETFAQELANKCNVERGHNTDFLEWKGMGENLHALTVTDMKYDLLKPMETWFREKENYRLNVSFCKAKSCDNYITMTWAKSDMVGCGIKYCNYGVSGMAEFEDDRVASYLVVCNYNAKFVPGEPPYLQGEPCSKCPAGFPKCRYNLCVTEEMFDGCKGYNGSTTWTGLGRKTDVVDVMDCKNKDMTENQEKMDENKMNKSGQKKKDESKRGSKVNSGMSLTSPTLTIGIGASLALFMAAMT